MPSAFNTFKMILSIRARLTPPSNGPIILDFYSCLLTPRLGCSRSHALRFRALQMLRRDPALVVLGGARSGRGVGGRRRVRSDGSGAP
jgi:hypothetical protein